MPDTNTLESLAQMFLMNSQNTGQQPIETANVGGNNLLVNRTGVGARFDNMMPHLQNLAMSFLMMQKQQKRQSYMKQLNDIMGSNVQKEDTTDSYGKPAIGKLGQMAALMTQISADDPELAKGIGAQEVIAQYAKQVNPSTEKPPTEVFTVHPVTGELNKSGETPAGAKIYRGRESPEERLGFEQKKANIIKQEQEKSKARDLLRDADLIQQDVAELMGHLDKVPVGRVGGTIAELEKKFGTDSPAALGLRDYEDSLELFLGKIAKTFGGEVGVLTDRDIERIRKAFPKYWMTKAERKNRIKFVKDYIQRRVDVFTKKVQGQATGISSQQPDTMRGIKSKYGLK